ncbi:hypothetical protein LCGC14_0809700 [marine sediment metagenome]|uniref:Beta-ketoacyl synthase N-terminal domain-containing protein n=1 Tax=marine sediment metagenome TaxID=412755 RepID=A0A0F9Q792_9ZZZZ
MNKVLVTTTGIGRASLEDLGVVSLKETPLRKMYELACNRALRSAGKSVPLPAHLNAGIAFSTVKGERFPHVWRDLVIAGKKLRPGHFLSAIHNAIPGYCAIQLGLIGPQIVLTSGSALQAAELQLLIGRAKLMLVCVPTGGKALAYVMEREDV